MLDDTKQCANCSNLKRDLSLIDIFCPRCTTHYCSFSCEAEHASIHQRFCRPMLPDNVQGFELSCRDDEDPIRSVEIHSRDEIHSRGEICPLSRYIDIPLVMYRHLKQNSMTMTYNPELDNRLASSLMVVPDSGYVIPKWQQNVGLVTVMREDHKPLKLKTLSMILAYCQVVMSVVGGGGGLKDPISPANFLKFCRIYDCEGKGRIYKLRSRFKKIEL
ncbi:hypothetical protein PLICRDRAFT_57953 [Plicaturopsis crispa FD-325 SS-3]|uniref:Unplaced genomic scaffold PLICRscaffold_19, whole genome shotgun sequence n=1 Tax=Plicaturopsis crispa FD-325 SS-3 TaxID=944288 RepID=A0A0C9T7J0_PLICR|nr:hypothetical protein PLICRDRAFT_57953 [Plicaturopsis crispa FD-325 SS-3]